MRALDVFDPNEIGLSPIRYSNDEAIVCCPFHDDSSPSASFNIKTGLFFCFSCGASYSADNLAIQLGGRVLKTWRKDYMRGGDTKDWRLLLRNPTAFDDAYLKSRGVIDLTISVLDIKKTDFGVVFPLHDRRDNVVGVTVRKYNGYPKYLTFGEKPPIYPQLYWQAEYEKVNFKFIAVVEGIFGFIRAKQSGVSSVATLGAMIKPQAASWLMSLNPKVMYGVFDNDFAGYVAGGRLLKLYPEAKVVIPGLEADELLSEEWKAIAAGGVYTTRDIRDLARLSKDPDKFYRYMPR